MARKKRRTESKESEAEQPVAERNPVVANPPRKRMGLLIASVVLLVGWLIYLVFVAWRVTMS